MGTEISSGPVSPGPDSPTKRQAIELFRNLPRRYDQLSAALSFWQDPRWRRALVDAIAPAAGERVLDVATGTGMVAAELLSRADCKVVGLDQSPEMLAGARARFAAGPEAARVELIEGQAERLPFDDGAFDALTFTYLLRYVDDPAATVRELARVLRPGGRIASLEFGVPPRPVRAYGLALLHRRRSARARTPVLARLGGGRAVSRSEHRGLLRPSSAGGDRRLLARGRDSRTSVCGA